MKPPALVYGVDQTVYLLADTAEDLAGAIDHYRAQGFTLKRQDRRASGEHSAEMRKGE